MKPWSGFLVPIAALMIGAAPAPAAQSGQASEQRTGSEAGLQATAGEQVSLSGTVRKKGIRDFTLDYGDGTVEVDMGEFGLAEEIMPVAGDKVVVSGRLDRDFLDHRTLEARSLHLAGVDETYHADPEQAQATAEQEGVSGFPWREVAEDGWLAITGRVETVSDETLALDTGYHTIVVDTTEMIDSPVDRELVHNVAVGDRISVTGTVEQRQFFEGRKLVATTLYLIEDAEEN